MLQLRGWEPWELLLLKGAIVLFVFPALTLVAAIAAALAVRIVASQNDIPLGDTAVMALAYSCGTIPSLVICRKSWPQVVSPEPCSGTS